MTFQDIIHECIISNWQPKFEWVNSIEECADRINLPHEDYPIGVDPTIEMIRLFSGVDRISWRDACNIQKYLYDKKMEFITKNSVFNLPNIFIDPGVRRKMVKVGKWKPPHPMFLQDLIEQIFPIEISSKHGWIFKYPGLDTGSIPGFWYRLFQTIHPFEDLNGRVGGIIVAALTTENGKYLSPVRF